MKSTDSLQRLGYDSWYQQQAGLEDMSGLEPARITAVHRDQYGLSDGVHDMSAELVGRLLYNAEGPLDLPAVGDWVLATFHNDHTFAVIQQVLPRRSLLRRKTPGKRVDFQLIAANVDAAFVMQSLDENFSLRRLERYLVMIHEGGILPIVLLSKSDLLDKDAVRMREQEIHQLQAGLEVISFSNLAEGGWTDVAERMETGKTYCLLGSSGIGKTTLLNNLLGSEAFATGEVRAYDSKGRHTTTARQLIILDNGAMLVDTPGMRELGNFASEEGLDETFTDIAALAGQCQFNDCTHTKEPGCAVLQALASGELDRARYENFMQLAAESSHGALTYQERRRQDRERGKYYKSVLKTKKGKYPQ